MFFLSLFISFFKPKLCFLLRISTSKPVKPKVTIEIASDQSDTVEPIPVVTASITLGVQRQSLLVGYGDRQFLHFENIVSPFFFNLFFYY